MRADENCRRLRETHTEENPSGDEPDVTGLHSEKSTRTRTFISANNYTNANVLCGVNHGALTSYANSVGKQQQGQPKPTTTDSK